MGAAINASSVTEHAYLLGFLFGALFDGGFQRFFLRCFLRIHTFGHDAYSTDWGCEIRYTPIFGGVFFYNHPLCAPTVPDHARHPVHPSRRAVMAADEQVLSRPPIVDEGGPRRTIVGCAARRDRRGAVFAAGVRRALVDRAVCRPGL